MPKIKKITAGLKKWLRILLVIAGTVFLIFILLAFTSLPFYARYYLGKTKAKVPGNTQTILMLGGGGYPSESVLMRIHYTSQLAGLFPGSKIVIATPGDTLNLSSTVSKTRQALIREGIDSARIIPEPVGLNTRHQALLAYELFKAGMIKQPIVVVSSPEHIYRSVLCFRKAGFTEVSGQPASESMLETDLRFEDNLLGGNQSIVKFGGSIPLRYKFWDYMKYEIVVLREYLAIAWYKLKGWM